jgi:hypothetical protein
LFAQILATRFANAMIVSIGGLPSDRGKSVASATKTFSGSRSS